MTCGDECPRVFARSCNPSRDAYWRESSEILWPAEDDLVVLDPEMLEPQMRPEAERVLLQVIRSHDGAFEAVCGVWTEPAG